MMEMVNASVAVEQLDDVVNTVMKSHGFGNKQSLTLDDFQSIMSNYNKELSDASLQTSGMTLLFNVGCIRSFAGSMLDLL